MDDRPAQIEALTARLALLEQRTADEAAAIRAALDELGSDQPARPTPPPIPLPALPVRAPSEPRHARDLATLSEPRALAFAGGVVTLFGIVLVFVLAANRGWIGPSIRCAIGAGVSGLLVVAALVIRRRFGSAASALAAAGAGVGGFFVTLYAASRGYHLLGNEFVWAGVVANAALAVALALAWRSEFLAALGLVAVVVAPLAVEGHLTGIGLGAGVSAAVVALGIGQQRCWRALGALVSGLAFIQVSVYILEARRHSFFDGSAVHIAWQHRTTAGVLACFVFGLTLAGAAAYQRHAERLDWLTAALASASLPLALLTDWALFHGDNGRGIVLLVAAAGYALTAGALWLDVRLRELAQLLIGFALFAVALATATFFSNGGLLTAWTLEGLTLIGLAVWTRRRRYQAAGIAYFAITAVHLFSFETPLRHLFTERAHPAQNIGALLLVIGALALAAALLRGRELLFPRLDLAAAGVASLFALFAVSLTVLEASQRLGAADLHAKFQRGETSVSALWAIVALALLASGLTSRSKELRYAGLSLLGCALAKLFLFDLSQLSSLSRAASFLAVGLALLAGGFLVQRFAAGGRRTS